MKKLNLSIPKPCDEDWNKMLPDEKGKFCQSCCKKVFDFTNSSTEEITAIFSNNPTAKICGRFKKEQLESIKIEVPEILLFNQTTFKKSFLLALFVVMGTTLFSCKDANNNVQAIEKIVVIKDHVAKNSDTTNTVIIADTVIKECKTIKHEKQNITPPEEPVLIEEPEIMGDIVMGLPVMPEIED